MQILLEDKGKKAHKPKLKQLKKFLINTFSTRSQKQMKCKFNKLTHSGITSGILFFFLSGCNPTESCCCLNISTVVSYKAFSDIIESAPYFQSCSLKQICVLNIKALLILLVIHLKGENKKSRQSSGADCGLEFDIIFILFLLRAVF